MPASSDARRLDDDYSLIVGALVDVTSRVNRKLAQFATLTSMRHAAYQHTPVALKFAFSKAFASALASGN